MMYTVGSLFSGIGGIDYAFQSAGFEIAFQCEIDKYCNQVLAKHWANVTRYQDVRTITGNQTGYVDVLAGGFPCQDISQAGKRQGIKDGTRSGLWFEFARLIGEIRPRIVFLENVAAITHANRERREIAPGYIVLGDLAEMGYDVEWFTVFASDAAAPHGRERWFAVAHTAGFGQRHTSERHNQVSIASGANSSNRRVLRSFAAMGRNANGVSKGLDAHQFPSRPGEKQKAYEPSRVLKHGKIPHRSERLKALGNAVVPQVVYPIAQAILAWLQAQDAQQKAA